MKASKIYTAQEMRVMETIVASGDIGPMTRERVALMLKQAAEMCERCEEVKEKTMHLWRAYLINRRRNSRIQVEVAAQDYDNAVARAKCINPEYVEVERCMKILSFSNK